MHEQNFLAIQITTVTPWEKKLSSAQRNWINSSIDDNKLKANNCTLENLIQIYTYNPSDNIHVDPDLEILDSDLELERIVLDLDLLKLDLDPD